MKAPTTLSAASDQKTLREGLEESARLMRRIHASATGRYRELEKRTGVTVAGARLLLKVSRHPGITVSKVARALDVRPSTVSNLVKSLEKSGWVGRRRDPGNQRTVRLELSAAGRQKVLEIGPDAEFFANLLAELDDDGFALVRRALEVIARRLPE